MSGSRCLAKYKNRFGITKKEVRSICSNRFLTQAKFCRARPKSECLQCLKYALYTCLVRLLSGFFFFFRVRKTNLVFHIPLFCLSKGIIQCELANVEKKDQLLAKVTIPYDRIFSSYLGRETRRQRTLGLLQSAAGRRPKQIDQRIHRKKVPVIMTLKHRRFS